MMYYLPKFKTLALAAAIVAGSAFMAQPAKADNHWSVGVGFGGYYPAGGYQTAYVPPPAVYSVPAPTYYYTPAPSYYYQAPAVVYAPPAPAYYYGAPYYSPFTFSFGFGYYGGGWGHGYYGGGYHGGGYHGGGYHGGYGGGGGGGHGGHH
ncbi:MAG TPA: hypothetical protein VM008_16675 [Phycisphaerae bacterium]|nr:hypothetical protein [Phycisphaerae bacterium]